MHGEEARVLVTLLTQNGEDTDGLYEATYQGAEGDYFLCINGGEETKPFAFVTNKAYAEVLAQPEDANITFSGGRVFGTVSPGGMVYFRTRNTKAQGVYSGNLCLARPQIGSTFFLDGSYAGLLKQINGIWELIKVYRNGDTFSEFFGEGRYRLVIIRSTLSPQIEYPTEWTVLRK
ncbi:MAG: hypothetical protein PUB07_07070 [Clostridia bacterium]|nr:hypothetical protein [Clostridia bacterium]